MTNQNTKGCFQKKWKKELNKHEIKNESVAVKRTSKQRATEKWDQEKKTKEQKRLRKMRWTPKEKGDGETLKNQKS